MPPIAANRDSLVHFAARAAKQKSWHEEGFRQYDVAMLERLVFVLSIIIFVVALLGAGQKWNFEIVRIQGQYSLRWLFVLLAVGPPVLALLWRNGDYVLKAVDRLAVAPQQQPAQRLPPNRRPNREFSAAWQEQYARDMEAINQVAICVAGAFLAASLILTVGAFWKSHGWTRPPKRSPLTWLALCLSLLAVAAFAVFVFTLPYDSASQTSLGGY